MIDLALLVLVPLDKLCLKAYRAKAPLTQTHHQLPPIACLIASKKQDKTHEKMSIRNERERSLGEVDAGEGVDGGLEVGGEAADVGGGAVAPGQQHHLPRLPQRGRHLCRDLRQRLGTGLRVRLRDRARGKRELGTSRTDWATAASPYWA